MATRFYYAFSDVQVEKTAQNIAEAFNIEYTEALTKIGITQDTLLTAVENLLETINQELMRSKTVENLKTVWRLLWGMNFTTDAQPSGYHTIPGRYYYLCINNNRLKCIREKTYELYNMKRTELSSSCTSQEQECVKECGNVSVKSDKKKKEKTQVKEEPVTTPTAVITPPTPVITPPTPVTPTDTAPIVEKKKRAPPKKKEPIATPDAVEGEVVVVEKKKRAPPKKKEPVATPTPVEGEEAPAVAEKKKRAPPKKKEPVATSDAVEGEVVVAEKKKRAPPKKKETPVV